LRKFELKRLKSNIDELMRIRNLLDSIGMRKDVSNKIHKRLLPIETRLIHIQSCLETDLDRFKIQYHKEQLYKPKSVNIF